MRILLLVALLLVSPAVAEPVSVEWVSDGQCYQPHDRYIEASGPNLREPYFSLKIDEDCPKT